MSTAKAKVLAPASVEGEPVRMVTGKVAPVEMVPLFYIDDVEYKAPARFPVNIALKYLRMTRKEGQDNAVSWLLEKVLGEEGYDALMDYDALTAEQLEGVVKLVTSRVVGALESPKGTR